MATVDEIYEFIGQLINDHAPPSWGSAILKAELAEGMVGVSGYFKSGDAKTSFSEIIEDRRLTESVKQLYQLTSVDSESKWNRMEYILEPSGKFKVNFEWDQEWVDEMERLANE